MIMNVFAYLYTVYTGVVLLHTLMDGYSHTCGLVKTRLLLVNNL